MDFNEAVAFAKQCDNTSTPMPMYVCHKKVWALKIKEIVIAPRPTIEELQVILDGGPEGSAAYLIPEGHFGPIMVSKEFMQKHEPKVGGYYVQYRNGYVSFSPAEAFEEGYARL